MNSIKTVAITAAILISAGPVFAKAASSNAVCLNKTYALYASSITLLDAASNYASLITQECQSADSKNICNVPDVSDIFGIVLSGQDIVASINLTSTYLDPLFAIYEDECASVSGKLCYTDGIASVSGQFTFFPFYAEVDFTGIPVCYSKSCNTSDLVNIISDEEARSFLNEGIQAMGGLPDGVDISKFSNEVTGINCKKKSSRNRALRRIASRMLTTTSKL